MSLFYKCSSIGLTETPRAKVVVCVFVCMCMCVCVCGKELVDMWRELIVIRIEVIAKLFSVYILQQ